MISLGRHCQECQSRCQNACQSVVIWKESICLFHQLSQSQIKIRSSFSFLLVELQICFEVILVLYVGVYFLSSEPRWACAMCGMYSSRKYSVKRHILNIVSFIDYIAGRRQGIYFPNPIPLGLCNHTPLHEGQ
jgi:hypothetical protein